MRAKGYSDGSRKRKHTEASTRNAWKTGTHQRENVTVFIKACRALGVREKDVFSTVDLYDAKDLRQARLLALLA